MLALAADAGAALGDQDVGVAGPVGFRPTYLTQHQRRAAWPGWSELPMTKVRKGPNWASIGLAQDATMADRFGPGSNPQSGASIEGCEVRKVAATV